MSKTQTFGEWRKAQGKGGVLDRYFGMDSIADKLLVAVFVKEDSDVTQHRVMAYARELLLKTDPGKRAHMFVQGHSKDGMTDYQAVLLLDPAVEEFMNNETVPLQNAPGTETLN